MYLVITILILIVWGIYGLYQKLTPPAPPIEDMEEHLKIIQSLPNQKARRKYLKSLRKK